MNQESPIVSDIRRISPIWIVPLIALLIAGWLAVKAWRETGPEIEVIFDDAAGITVGKTQVKFRDVVIGQVKDIKLSSNFEKVAVLIELDRQVESLISVHSRFWVVSPRISLSKISGLDTLLSGVYIEMDPGGPGSFENHFSGLTEPPSIRSYEKGTQFTLLAEELGSLDIDSPVYHRQIPVGEVTRYRLRPNEGKVDISIFVHAPYDQLIKDRTRFWNVSGIDFKLGATGLSANMETLSSLLSGGLAFETPPDIKGTSKPAQPGSEFFLFTDKEAVAEGALTVSYPYLIRFNSSVRGLTKGAPVEFRGIQVGKVEHVGLNYGIDEDRLVDVAISIQPERVDPNNVPSVAELNRILNTLASQGMRAQLKPRNILTGALYIDLVPDYSNEPQDDHQENAIARYGDYWVLPSAKNQELQIVRRVSDIAKRLEALPFESIGQNLNKGLEGFASVMNGTQEREIVQKIDSLLQNMYSTSDSLSDTVHNMQTILVDLDQMVAPDSPLHYRLIEMLKDVSQAASAMQALGDQLSREPNALILGREEAK